MGIFLIPTQQLCFPNFSQCLSSTESANFSDAYNGKFGEDWHCKITTVDKDLAAANNTKQI